MAKKSGMGIIIGRFQTFELNPVHIKLIESVRKQHKRFVIFLTSNPAPSDRNPLEWIFRWKMLEEVFGEKLEVEEMPDLPDDRIWSQELDRRILELRPEGDVALYGTDEGFVSRYSGRHATHILEASEEEVEAEMTLDAIQNFRDFRAGVLYGMLKRFPTVYPTVDIAVFRKEHRELLLARKANETKYRLPGGFTDPIDESYEEAAMRELGEECGELEIDELTYLGSSRIADWRYQGSWDGVITHLYTCVLTDGEPEAGDDIVEVRWFDVAKINVDLFVQEHRVLWGILEEYLEEEGLR